jgi:hypothetical protein
MAHGHLAAGRAFTYALTHALNHFGEPNPKPRNTPED